MFQSMSRPLGPIDSFLTSLCFFCTLSVVRKGITPIIVVIEMFLEIEVALKEFVDMGAMSEVKLIGLREHFMILIPLYQL